MHSRRSFLKNIGAAAGAAMTGALFQSAKAKDIVQDLNTYSGSAQEIATDETFWHKVQQAFTVD